MAITPTNVYSRYDLSSANGVQTSLPFISLDSKSTDKQVVWQQNVSRMDILSNLYYGLPYYGFLIMIANPEYTMEFDIPNNTIITVPFPLDDTLTEYNNKIVNFGKPQN